MEIFLTVVNILLIFVLTQVLFIIVIQPMSRAQIAFILFDIFVIVFVFGLELELIHADTVEAALSGLAVQYLGQCGFLIALLWFANEFINIRLPRGIFIAQTGISVITMFGILTAGWNRLFYSSTRIVREGMYPRILCGRGILWYVHYAYFMGVFLFIIIVCVVRYHTSGPIHRRRILYLAVGLGILVIELVLKGLGLFGSYNPVSIALTGTVICMMMAVIKEGYFDSINATMQNVLNHGDEGLIVLDAWSRIIFVNDKAYSLFPDITIGLPVMSQKKIYNALQKEEDTLAIGDSIWEVRLEDIAENGVRTGSMLYFINVTDLVRQSEQLKAVNEERVRFMTKASHELRSPLNVVLGADEMIIRESRDPSINEYAGLIREEVGSMVNLVEDIINSSLAEQELLTLKEEDFSLRQTLLHLNTVYIRKGEDHGLRFSLLWDGVSVKKHQEVMVNGDKNRVLQVLINLLDNAVKYTDKGQFGLTVTDAGTTEGKTAVEFVVWDTGTGIPESEQKEIFEKFRRAKEAERSGKEGLGLGLSIVKGFVETMGGKISLASRPGEGSRFTVTIPFRAANVSAEENGYENPDTAGNQEISFAGRKLLAVDDRPRNIMVMRHLLKTTGINVEEAHSGREAVDMCRKDRYDALLIDYMMPGMNGTETLQTVRSDSEGQNQDTYAIVFSANVTPDAERMYKEAGFSDFLSKPVYYDNLVGALRKAFRRTGGTLENLEKEDTDTGESEKTLEGGEILERLRNLGVDTAAGIAYSDEDADFYEELLRSFAKDYAHDRDDLMEAWEAIQNGSKTLPNGLDSWKEFTRIAHGIKGELRAFGDSYGADLFYSLEKAGKAGHTEDIEANLTGAIMHLSDFAEAVTGE